MELDSDKAHYSDEDYVADEGKILDKWLYSLACIFYGSSGFGEYSSEYKSNHNLRKRFQEGEVNTLLISIASFSRRNIEVSNKRTFDMARESSPDAVGELVKTTSREEVMLDLSYREACNKIIHAKKVNFDYVENPPNYGGTLNPKVYLYGDYNGHDWRAILDINLFIESAWNYGPG